ncbi:PulJ/GspJ family protein [Pirellulaceae bacterium SH449]
MCFKSLNRLSRRGLTILEVMIATTLTMLILLALTASFKRLSDAVTIGRTRITLSDQLRGIVQLLNKDLEMRTIGGQTPQSFGSGNGYFKYLDGGMCDWSATVANSPSSIDLAQSGEEFKKEDLLKGGSRWGDVDDILMFTARARDGQLFRGKMPRALMMYANWNAVEKENELRIANGLPPLPNNSPLPTDADWAEDIAISSEFAEIVWFTVPLNLSDAGLYEPSTYNIVLNRGQIENFLPRRMALCRKVLLVRPDLDITPPPAQRVYNNSPNERLYYVQPTSPLAESSSTVAFETVNANAYQRCDLSVSTHTVLGPSGNVFLSYKTNSLSDLQDPQNRYAHGVYPISDGSSIIGATLPMMMLTNGIDAVALPTCQNALNAIQGGTNPSFTPSGGFIPPFFLRVAYRPVDPSNWRTWVPYSTLQEMITPDILAFDLKAFDASAPVIFHPGPDGQWGDARLDDNGDGTLNNAAEAGWFGTDDVTVDPSQPGFWQVLSLVASPFDVPIEVERGAYVDMGWAFRSMPGTSVPAARAPMLISEFSGMSSTGVSPFLIQGGAISLPNLAAHTIGTPNFIFQNAFDTFTTQYDSDGEQDLLGPEFGSTQRFRYSRHALNRFGYTVVSANPLANQDPDGVDVPPPYPSELRSIQATIRVQDRTAQAIQQISVIHSLVD